MFTTLAAVIAVVLSCVFGGEALSTSSSPKNVVATTGMVGDVVKAVGGDNVTVNVLMGEGVDPHLYRPRASDVRAILGADAVFYNGLHLEGRMGEVLERAAARGREVVAIAEVIPKDKQLRPEDDGGSSDPHVWMDAELWSSTIGPVTEALCKMDPENCTFYKANSERAAQRYKDLDTYAGMMIETIPVKSRVLVTAHDAFGYFGKAYGLEVRGIQGVNTESEAGLADINQLVEFIVSNDIPAVFVESSVSEKNVQALIEGAAARGHALSIGGELFSDAMGKPGTWEGTYPGMIDHNVNTITGSLGGTVLPGGFRSWMKDRNSTPKDEKTKLPPRGDS
jgi:manganese/zinc/iron transport system substrate-binding protein